MKYNTSLTLSHRINSDGSLTQQTEDRVKKSIDLYFEGLAETLTMSGGYADKEAPFTHAEAMKRFALQRNIHEGDIHLESTSLDTVGQAVFSKRNVVIPQKWDRLVVVSHDYHLERVKKIFDFVYGKDFDINYVGVFSIFSTDSQVLQKERANWELTRETFEGVTPGNDDDILDVLVEKHPLYKNFR
ncbi:MAG: YdcF family protein [Nanoarchaeota archaeon]|nr:YdcF family protein [Nanoarchaeota archaeon]